jgi:hypothetical protein
LRKLTKLKIIDYRYKYLYLYEPSDPLDTKSIVNAGLGRRPNCEIDGSAHERAMDLLLPHDTGSASKFGGFIMWLDLIAE